MAIQLFKNRTILVKVEGTYGTDAAPVVGTDALLSFEGSVQLDADQVTRDPDRPYFGGKPFVLTNKRATVTFAIEMLGHTTVGNAAPIGPVLRACGHGETLVPVTTATYAPVSASFASVTCYFYHAGLLYELVGNRGTIDWEIQIGGYARGRVTLTGVIDAFPAETAPGTPVLTAFQTPPTVETDTLTIQVNAAAVNARGITLNQGGDVRIYEGSESREVSIADRVPTGTLTVYQEALATLNPWTRANGHLLNDISVVVNGGAGKITTLNIDQAQFGYPRITDLDGAVGWEIPFTAMPNTGGDEYEWVFT